LVMVMVMTPASVAQRARDGLPLGGPPARFSERLAVCSCWGSSRRPPVFLGFMKPTGPSAGTPYELCPPGAWPRVSPQVSLPFPRLSPCLFLLRFGYHRVGGGCGEWLCTLGVSAGRVEEWLRRRSPGKVVCYSRLPHHHGDFPRPRIDITRPRGARSS